MCLGIPGQVVAITDAENKLGRVDFGGVSREVSLVCVAEEGEPIEACIGAWVIVHVGFAISRVDPDEADRALSLLQEMADRAAAQGVS